MPFSFSRSAAFALPAAFFLFFAAASCRGQAKPDIDARLEELSSQAQAAQQSGDYASAAKCYQELVQLRPDVAEIWANLGLMRQFLGDSVQADHDFQVALTKNSQLYVPNLFLGLNQLRMRKARSALHYLKAAVALNKEDEQAALGLGRAYAGVQDDSHAARWFERALQINPRDPDAWYELGVSYSKLQNSAAMQLKDLDPNNVYARTLVADSFVEQSRSKDAIPIYEKFRSQHGPPCMASKLGFAYALTGSVAKAKEIFQEELHDDKGCLLARVGLARVAMISGDFDEMLRQLDTVNEREPNFLHTYLQDVWNGIEPDQLKKAVTELQKPEWAHDPMTAVVIESANSGIPPALPARSDGEPPTGGNSKITPEELWEQGRYSACAEKIQGLKVARPAAVTTLLDRCSFYAGDYRLTLDTSEHELATARNDREALYWQAKSAQELSSNAFAQINTVAPDSPKVHLLMAELHRAKEEFAAAEAEYNEVLNNESHAEAEMASARLGLAYVYLHDTEDDKAFEQLQAILKSDPSNVDAHSLMGQVLVRRHLYDDAIPHLRLALQGVSTSSLPEVHSLLAKCYSARGKYAEALEELKPALPADTMGTFHYQLYQVYQKLGDEKSATEALLKSEQLRKDKARAEQEHLELTRP